MDKHQLYDEPFLSPELFKFTYEEMDDYIRITGPKEPEGKDFRYMPLGYTGEDIFIPTYINNKPVTELSGFMEDNWLSCTNSIRLPCQIKIIKHWTFLDCINIEEITIPDSVTEIEDEAFRGCDSLAKVVFGRNLKHIGDDAFLGCYSLKIIHDYPESYGHSWAKRNGYTVIDREGHR
jgi:hypothetical protein